MGRPSPAALAGPDRSPEAVPPAPLDLTRRSTEPEQLDGTVPEAEAVRSLADLRLVNRWLGGERSLLGALRPLLAPGTAPLTLLDVGCGSGDLPAAAARLAPGRLRVVGVDLKRLHLRQAPPGVRRLQADARVLPLRPRSVDYVTASLFLHHFDGDEVASVLGELWRVARRGLVVNDLHRARVPYFFARVTFPTLMRSRVSVDDGLISIRRAFTPQELRAAFRQAGIASAVVRRRFPYRLVGVARRTG